MQFRPHLFSTGRLSVEQTSDGGYAVCRKSGSAGNAQLFFGPAVLPSGAAEWLVAVGPRVSGGCYLIGLVQMEVPHRPEGCLLEDLGEQAWLAGRGQHDFYDNVTSGKCLCAIEDTGELFEPAMDQQTPPRNEGYLPGDSIQVRLDGGLVHFSRNGREVWSAGPFKTSEPLYFFVSLFNEGAEMEVKRTQ
eukprot:TRINITY_DN4605_c0_g1_i2.p2 TRINITY_DN4605_c0_g1~~TRINITY_DN4605_c0_g1_i2.p2  ORF type:complete len:190 (+),score=37.28 TRINITY_DN4605_c0_g1_i2:424-993(+)